MSDGGLSMHDFWMVDVIDLDADRYKGVEEVYKIVFLGQNDVLLRDSDGRESVVKRDGEFLRRFAFVDDGLNEARLLDAEDGLSAKLDEMLYNGYERDIDFILEMGKLKDVHKQKQDRLQRIFGLDDIDFREDRIVYYGKKFDVDDFLRDILFPLRDSKDHKRYVLNVVRYLETAFQHSLFCREYELGMSNKRLREKDRVTKWDERHSEYLEERVEGLDLTLTRLEAIRRNQHHDHDLFFEAEEKEEKYWNFGRVCDYAVKGVAFATLALMFGLPASCVMQNFDRVVNDPLSFLGSRPAVVAEASNDEIFVEEDVVSEAEFFDSYKEELEEKVKEDHDLPDPVAAVDLEHEPMNNLDKINLSQDDSDAVSDSVQPGGVDKPAEARNDETNNPRRKVYQGGRARSDLTNEPDNIDKDDVLATYTSDGTRLYFKDYHMDRFNGTSWRFSRKFFDEDNHLGNLDHADMIYNFKSKKLRLTDFVSVLGGQKVDGFDGFVSDGFVKMQTQRIDYSMPADLEQRIVGRVSRYVFGDSFAEIKQKMNNGEYDERHFHEIVSVIQSEVRQYFVYDDGAEANKAFRESRNTLETFVSLGRGDCDDFNTYYVAVLRDLGVASRVASGYLNYDGVIRTGDRHMWAEVFDPNNGWVIYDATGFGGSVGVRPPVAADLFEDEEEQVVGDRDIGVSASTPFLDEVNEATRIAVEEKERIAELIASGGSAEDIQKRFKHFDEVYGRDTRRDADLSNVYISSITIDSPSRVALPFVGFDESVFLSQMLMEIYVHGVDRIYLSDENREHVEDLFGYALTGGMSFNETVGLLLQPEFTLPKFSDRNDGYVTWRDGKHHLGFNRELYRIMIPAAVNHYRENPDEVDPDIVFNLLDGAGYMFNVDGLASIHGSWDDMSREEREERWGMVGELFSFLPEEQKQLYLMHLLDESKTTISQTAFNILMDNYRTDTSDFELNESRGGFLNHIFIPEFFRYAHLEADMMLDPGFFMSNDAVSYGVFRSVFDIYVDNIRVNRSASDSNTKKQLGSNEYSVLNAVNLLLETGLVNRELHGEEFDGLVAKIFEFQDKVWREVSTEHELLRFHVFTPSELMRLYMAGVAESTYELEDGSVLGGVVFDRLYYGVIDNRLEGDPFAGFSDDEKKDFFRMAFNDLRGFERWVEMDEEKVIPLERVRRSRMLGGLVDYLYLTEYDTLFEEDGSFLNEMVEAGAFIPDDGSQPTKHVSGHPSLSVLDEWSDFDSFFVDDVTVHYVRDPGFVGQFPDDSTRYLRALHMFEDGAYKHIMTPGYEIVENRYGELIPSFIDGRYDPDAQLRERMILDGELECPDGFGPEFYMGPNGHVYIESTCSFEYSLNPDDWGFNTETLDFCKANNGFLGTDMEGLCVSLLNETGQITDEIRDSYCRRINEGGIQIIVENLVEYEVCGGFMEEADREPRTMSISEEEDRLRKEQEEERITFDPPKPKE